MSQSDWYLLTISLPLILLVPAYFVCLGMVFYSYYFGDKPKPKMQPPSTRRRDGKWKESVK